jgi:hypothetical protein
MTTSKPYTDRSNSIRAARKAFGCPTGKDGVDFIISNVDGLYHFSPMVTEPAQEVAASAPAIMADAPDACNLVAGGDLLAAMTAAMANGTVAATEAHLAKAQSVTAKRKRVDMATTLGQAKARLEITSGKNAGYQKHCDRMYELAQAGDIATLAAYPVKGTNTYAKMLRRYRDALAA